MGYLSQKKHQARENIFLYVTAFFLMILSCLALIKPDLFYAGFNLFHLYCLSLALLIYSAFVKKYFQTFIFFLCFILNYTLLSASGNIFFSDNFQGRKLLTLYFSKDDTAPAANFSQEDILSSGTVLLSHHYIAPYTIVDIAGKPLTLLKVDFRNPVPSDYDSVFKNLNDFLLTQDNPVIIFGEFGLPIWARPFKTFLDVSGLQVKNRLVFTKGSPFNIFTTPSFYILGFQDMGLSSIKISTRPTAPTVSADISFTLGQP